MTEALRDTLVAAEKALEPFAKAATDYAGTLLYGDGHRHEPTNGELLRDVKPASLQVGDLRRASSALALVQTALRNLGQATGEEARDLLPVSAMSENTKAMLGIQPSPQPTIAAQPTSGSGEGWMVYPIWEGTHLTVFGQKLGFIYQQPTPSDVTWSFHAYRPHDHFGHGLSTREEAQAALIAAVRPKDGGAA